MYFIRNQSENKYGNALELHLLRKKQSYFGISGVQHYQGLIIIKEKIWASIFITLAVQLYLRLYPDSSALDSRFSFSYVILLDYMKYILGHFLQMSVCKRIYISFS